MTQAPVLSYSMRTAASEARHVRLMRIKRAAIVAGYLVSGLVGYLIAAGH